MTETPEQFLQKIHEIASVSASEQEFEINVREFCQRLSRKIQILQEVNDGKDSKRDRRKN